jgi:hypothetical protein
LRLISGTESRCAKVQNGISGASEMSLSRGFGVLSSVQLGETTEQTTKVKSLIFRAVLSLPGRSEASRELFCTSLRAFKHCIFQLSALL